MRRLAGMSVFIVVGLALASGPATSIHRDGFDGGQPRFRRGPATIPFREEAHAITQQHAHTAPASEYIKITAEESVRELNPVINYIYATPHAPISDETSANIWVRANRPGVQLMARIVLPKERDPADLAAPLTVLVPGEKLSLAGGRWQRLEIRKLPKSLDDERQRLRARLNKDIDIADAYVDQLVLNLYTGSGPTEVWVDDLELTPVPVVSGDQTPAMQSEARSKAAPPAPPVGVRPLGPAPVEFQRDQLRVNGRPVLLRGIRHTDTPLKALRDAGLNTLFFPDATPPAVAAEAIQLGFWLVPSVPIDGDTATKEVARQAGDDAVLAWHLGDWRTSDQLDSVVRTAAVVRAADPQRPISCDVREGFWSYSRHIDMVGTHRWPLFTSLNMSKYRDWLVQRRNLCRPNTFTWSWVQTHLPDWYLDVLHPARNAAGFSEPVGPHPEQVRILTYLSVASGAKGIAYYSDRALSDAQQGRDRLLQIALLNQELSLLEPLLVTAVDTPNWIDTSVPQVKAAIFRSERGVLVMPIWLGEDTQYVPEQGSSSKVVMTVPQVPVGTQAWDVSPGEVRSLLVERVVGGTQVTLPEFDHTAAIVFTADTSPTGMLVRWQDLVRRMAPNAAQWNYDLANVTLSKVETVQKELTRLGVALPDTELLLKSAREGIQRSRSAWEANDYRTAYREAQRAQRPLRVLARAQWSSLLKGMDPPTASPYGVSYYSLPQHVALVRQIAASSPRDNVLPDGDFENGKDLPAGWQIVLNTLDDVELSARSTDDAATGQRALLLQVKPKAPPAGQQPPPPPQALERTFLAAESTPVRLTPGSLVRISFQVKVPLPLTASADGLVVYDSAAGEALGVRIAGPVPQWKRFTLYRQVPADGEIRVVAALTGLGVALIDDVRIEPLVAGK
jgi:hypothetical protein